MSKGSSRRREDTAAIRERWPFGEHPRAAASVGPREVEADDCTYRFDGDALQVRFHGDGFLVWQACRQVPPRHAAIVASLLS